MKRANCCPDRRHTLRSVCMVQQSRSNRCRGSPSGAKQACSINRFHARAQACPARFGCAQSLCAAPTGENRWGTAQDGRSDCIHFRAIGIRFSAPTRPAMRPNLMGARGACLCANCIATAHKDKAQLSVDRSEPQFGLYRSAARIVRNTVIDGYSISVIWCDH